jgi:hypothetical protein
MRMAYTPNEIELLKILKKQKGKPIETTKIVLLRYPDEDDRPKYARESVVCVLNYLIEKVKRCKEPFKILKSPRRGPHPSKYWIA